MKNTLLLGVLLTGAAGLFSACSDDRDSNPVLLKPTEFVLNTPTFVNDNVDLVSTDALHLEWSQPVYTTGNAPINVTYEVQVSPTGSFTTSFVEAANDESGATVADYAAIDKTSEYCTMDVSAADFNKALMRVCKWAEDAVPQTIDAYVRICSFIKEGTNRINPIPSNVVKVSVSPYYVLLKEADPIMWFLVGNKFGDGNWSNKPGVSSFPMFKQSDYAYDKVTGEGEIVYLNYFDNEGWKIQPADFNWDYGFMGDGSSPNTAVYRNGSSTDKGNIWCDPAGFYKVTVNTKKFTCSIEKQDDLNNNPPTVYGSITIGGSFGGWDAANDIVMTPVYNNENNHVWCATMTVGAGNKEEFKFKGNGGWDTNWGFGAGDGTVYLVGKGVQNGGNLALEEGTWIIMFNDITGEFSIIAAN